MSHSCWHFQRMALKVADILGLSVFKTINETLCNHVLVSGGINPRRIFSLLRWLDQILFVIICLWNHEIKLWYTKSLFVCKLFLHNQELSNQNLILRYIWTLWWFLSISDIITLSCCLATTYQQTKKTHFQYLCTYKSIIHTIYFMQTKIQYYHIDHITHLLDHHLITGLCQSCCTFTVLITVKIIFRMCFCND